ncbi:MAG TPA: DUF502 domain-containing protein [Pirellulales bacterium]|nr:DUF502 domain-containing protein [Pirellulales bacterium]
MLRGLGVVLPPLLTVVIFLWVAGTIQQYALEPVTIGARNVMALYWSRQDAEKLADPAVQKQIADSPGGEPPSLTLPTGERYDRSPGGLYLPRDVLQAVTVDDPAGVVLSGNPRAVYQRYAELKYLTPQRVVPIFLCVFVLLLYLLGKFLAAGIGRVLWNVLERGVYRLPLVRNVYDSVKQVTDFMFDDREIEYTRVVAVEYPRKGIWSIGFVTGESLADIRSATGEPMLSMMIPSSPMSVTGYTITVPKSETIDLNLTMDQALQFVISCGVVVPAHQVNGNLETAT